MISGLWQSSSAETCRRLCVYCIRIQFMFCLVSGSVTTLINVTKHAMQ